MHSSGGGIKSDQLKARVAMLVGATLMSGAAATKEEEGGSLPEKRFHKDDPKPS